MSNISDTVRSALATLNEVRFMTASGVYTGPLFGDLLEQAMQVEPLEVWTGTADPTVAPGIVGSKTGDLYLRDAPGVGGGQLWVRFGDTDTSWSPVGFDQQVLDLSTPGVVLPMADDTTDLGSVSKFFKNLYIKGNSYFGSSTPFLGFTTPGSAWFTGKILSDLGFLGECQTWGSGLSINLQGSLDAPIKSGTGSYDLTGGPFERLFTSTGGSTAFAQADADNHRIIRITSGVHLGAYAEIEVFIDAHNVILDTPGWDADLTAETFAIYPHSVLLASNNGYISGMVGADRDFEIHALNHTNDDAVHFEYVAGAANLKNLLLETNAAGFTSINSIRSVFSTGALAAGSLGLNMRLLFDETLATDDPSSILDHILFTTTNTHPNIVKNALHVNGGFTNALLVDASPASNPGYGYTAAGLVPTDHVNSGGGGDDAFINPNVNATIFSSFGDYILIGSDNIFVAIQVILATNASSTVRPSWEYSTGDGTWNSLAVSDGTVGFTRSGVIVWVAPVDWAPSAHVDGVTGDITNAYYLRIQRHMISALFSLPVESYFKIYAGANSTTFLVRGDGTIKPVQIADTSAQNESIYYSTTQSALVYKDSGGIVHPLY